MPSDNFHGLDAGISYTEIGRAQSELQSLRRISYAVFCLKKKNKKVILFAPSSSANLVISIIPLFIRAALVLSPYPYSSETPAAKTFTYCHALSLPAAFPI